LDNSLVIGRIKELSSKKNVSITKMLAELGIRQSLVYDMGKLGKTPSGEILEKLADYLDCSVDYLLGRTDKPEVNR